MKRPVLLLRAATALALLTALPAVADDVPPLTPPPAAAPTLNQTLDSFHPSPRQTIALRDFLGARGEKMVGLGPQKNGLTLFDLRDTKNQRVGQIAVGANPTEGTIFVARLSGPATFDMSRRANPPRVLDPKMRGAIQSLLAGAEAGPVYEAAILKNHDLFIRDRPLLAVLPQSVTFPDRVILSDASFFADGSGFFRSYRAPVGVKAPAQPPIHVSAKYYPALEADGTRAFREAVLGVDADFTATLADFGNKVCSGSACIVPATMTIRGDVHLTRWPHAIVPSAPANLIAQISPPPPQQPDALQQPDGSTAPPQPGAIDATGNPSPGTN